MMKQEIIPQPVDWSLMQVWNAIAIKHDRPLQKRDYVYASELNQPMIDRVMKMNAVPYTNPPNDRSRRKFLCGNLIEFLVRQILVATGFYDKHELKIDAKPYDDCLEVHGRCDFKSVIGYIDKGMAFTRLNEMNLPEEIYNLGKGIIESLDGVFIKGKILEIKSISSFGFEKVEKTKMAIPAHTLQAYHYQKNGGIPCELVYISKDDLRMQQFSIDPTIAEDIYRKDLEKITFYFKKKKMPPKEPLATFEPLMGKFQKNLGVEYSPYLLATYQISTPEAFRQQVKFVESWNRALSRYVKAETGQTTPTGKPINITPGNKETRAQIEAAGFNFDNLLRAAIEAGVAEEEELAEF